MNLFSQFTKGDKESLSDRKDAIIYTRVSTKEQAENNTSLETQKEFCERFAKRKNLKVVSYFGGTYESAKSDEREEFQKMISYAKRTKNVAYIIVYSYDRFSRIGTNAAYITKGLKECGIQILSVTQETNPETSSGTFQQNLFYLFSQFDNDMRRERTVTGMSELLRKGYWVHQVPIGYSVLNPGSKAVDRKIVVNETGKKLQKAFKWKSEGMSSVGIIKKLKQLGLDLDERRLSEIFRNPLYCGVMVSKMTPGEAIEGNHEKLISKELFFRVNDILKDNNHPLDHSADNHNLPLKRFVLCEGCGLPLTGFLVKKKNLYYYKCRTKGCSCTKNASKLHLSFRTLLTSFEVDKKFAPVIRDVMMFKIKELSESRFENTKEIKKTLTGLKNKLEQIEERYVTGEIDKDLFQKYSEKYKTEVIQIEKEIDRTSNFSSNLEKCISSALEISTNLEEKWNLGDISAKQKIQRLVFPDGVRYDKQNDRVQTTRVNSLFSPIQELTKVLRKNESGDPIKIDQISALVTPEGFKPPTLRAEI
ncbi:MAG: recombinase family protein [Crocinitomicaceae bacterium]